MFYKFIPIFLILILWQAITSFGFVSPIFVPVLSDVILVLVKKLFEIRFWLDFGSTIWRALVGLGFGILVGLMTGFGLSVGTKFKFSWQLIFDFLRSVPVVALYPLFILVFGFGDWSKIFAVAWGCSFLVGLNTFYGIFHGSKIRIQSAKLLGLSGWDLLHKVIIPQSSPQIMTGIRLAASYSLVISLITEIYFGSTNGLGKSLVDSQLNYEIPQVYALIFVVGLVGFGWSKIIQSVEKKILFWI